MSKVRRGERTSESKGAAPAAIVLAILVAVVILVAGAALLLGSAPAELAEPATSPAASSPTPDIRLTDEEAIRRFRQLNSLRSRALEERRVDLLEDAFVAGGPAERRLARTISRLRQQRAFADEQLEVLRLSVVKNTDSEITVEQVSVLDVRFRDRAGNDITAESGRERQRTQWILRPQGASWLIYDGVIVEARPLRP